MPTEPTGKNSPWGRRLALAAFLLVFALPVLAVGLYHAKRQFVFAGLAGPERETQVPDVPPARWTDFRKDGTSRLAILLTGEDSAWLGLAHGLKSLGVPFTITRDPAEALRHRVVLVYPLLSGRALPPEALRALAAHPRSGGTLIASNVLGGGLDETFGFSGVSESRRRFSLTFTDRTSEWLGLSEPEERSLQFGEPAKGEAQLGTVAYAEAGEVLGTYDDGSAGIVGRRFGTGVAYALGFDPGFLLLTGQNARGTDLERDYVNAYSPQADVVLRFLRRAWREGEPLATSVSPVPEGKDLAAIMTFDVDYTHSLPNAEAYAGLLREAGIRGTFFIQTKYMRDYNDAVMLTDETVGHLARLGALGMELASHTVAHARAFSRFPLGSGRERYPDYQPVVQAQEEATGGTILGELRVSKFLLETLAPPAQVLSFRPGHLANPFALPQALEATGYRFSSSVTSGVSLTHLPFRLTRDRLAAAETGVFEFPITVEDERAPLLGLRLQASLDLARKIGRNGGAFVVLIHPNILGHKFEFLRGLVDGLRGTAWIGALEDYGRWWAARDGLEIDAERRGGRLVLRLSAAGPVAGLALEPPPGWIFDPGASRGVAARETPRGILVDRAESAAEIVLNPAP